MAVPPVCSQLARAAAVGAHDGRVRAQELDVLVVQPARHHLGAVRARHRLVAALLHVLRERAAVLSVEGATSSIWRRAELTERRVPEAAASVQAAHAAPSVAEERPEPQEAPPGKMGRRRHTQQGGRRVQPSWRSSEMNSQPCAWNAHFWRVRCAAAAGELSGDRLTGRRAGEIGRDRACLGDEAEIEGDRERPCEIATAWRRGGARAEIGRRSGEVAPAWRRSGACGPRRRCQGGSGSRRAA